MFPEREIDAFVKQILEEKGNGAHTYDHTRRVLSVALEIGKKVRSNIRVLGAASLLHDIGRSEEEKTKESHSIISGRISREFLPSIGYSTEEINHIVAVIRTHRFSEGIEPTSIEGKILSDADKIDAIGAIGVFRAVTQVAVKGRGIEGFLTHANEKLLKLAGLLYTEEAKRIAKERHNVLEVFVNQLKKETQES
ncbi:MAG: HD domain-containing protein [Candidatus Thorarchaeota archaeon]|nr:HD domain-containing protein [Candidatus Thorarchaeota archaeon]